MKKILTIVSAFLLPAISFAQGYMGRGYTYDNFGSGSSILGIFLILLIPIVWLCLVVSVFVFWILMLIDAIKHSPEKSRLIWVIVIIFTHIIGALIYYFVEKKPRHKIKHAEKKEETK